LFTRDEQFGKKYSGAYMAEDCAVELQDVIKQFGNVIAVNHVSLQIKDGEFFSLLGPSGCGKTTSLRLIAGFEMPTSGEVYIGGKQQGYLPAYQRPVNTVFQNYALFPHMSVEQNVSFGLEMKGVPKDEATQRVKEALDLVHLTGMGKRKPKQLSGGQQQRVALARALVNYPKVLLLDEPLGALDLKLRKAMQVELKSIQEQVGITFVYVTHDQEEALTMSDRIGVMSQGEILQIGSPGEIYEHPATRFVSDFIGETNYLSAKIIGKQGEYYEIFVDPEFHMLAKATENITFGSMVSVAFRPEKAFVQQDSQDGYNQIRGKIIEIIYTGSTTALLIEIPGGQQFIIRQQNLLYESSRIERLADEVNIIWPIETTRIFTD
jgi:spermidine/putrescine transport system ATP-binding protein